MAETTIPLGDIIVSQDAAGLPTVEVTGLGGSGKGGGGTSLAALDDVTLAGLADLDVLQYDNTTTQWLNRSLAAAGISPLGHDHDDLYYTEAEVDALLATKAAVAHTHPASEVTAGAFAAGDFSFPGHLRIGAAGAPLGSGVRKVEIAGVGGGVSDYGSLALSNASDSGNNLAGSIDFYANSVLLAAIRVKVGGPTSGIINFFTRNTSGSFVQAFRFNQAQKALIGTEAGYDGSGAALDVDLRTFGAVSRVLNLHNSQSGVNSDVELGFKSTFPAGMLDVAAIRARKLVVTAGAEVGDLAFYTRNVGVVQVSARLTSVGNFELPVATAHYKVGVNQVLGARVAGWAAATGTKTRTTFDTATVTLPLLAERVAALIDDGLAHGFIGA